MKTQQQRYGVMPIWDEFSKLEASLQNMFKDPFFDNWQSARFPKITIVEDKKNYNIFAALPGFEKNEVSVGYVDNKVIISGKREKEELVEERGDVKILVNEIARRNFSRSIALEKPCNIDGSKVKFVDGELVIVIPKTEEVKDSVKSLKIE